MNPATSTSGSDVGVPIVLAGSGRSGTTWLIESLSLASWYRPVFEPLHFDYVENVPVNWWNKYLRSADQHRKLQDHFEKVFYARADKDWYRWMHFRIPNDAKLHRKIMQAVYYLPNVRPWAKQRVVKLIKANLMLEWLYDHFKPTIVFITRHPCAVVASRLARGTWHSPKSKWMRQRSLIDDHLQSKMHWIHNAKSPIQYHAVSWCVENLLPFAHLRNNSFKIHHVRYRDLVERPRETFAELLDAVRLPKDIATKLIQTIVRRKRPDPVHLNKWKTQLDTGDISFVQKCVEAFELPFE